MGNWKMNKTNQEAKDFVSQCGPIVELAKSHNIDIGVAPTFLALCCAKKHAPEGLIISSQNVHHLSSGAYTGEVSTEMLQAIGVNWAIIGHSERRTYNNETSEACNLKIRKLLAANMTPLYCCGESLETYEKGETKAFIQKQIEAGFKDLCPKCARKVVIAYEPIWSIGTGKNASKEIAEDICSFIRGIIAKLFDKETSEEIRILYGGSVKPNNIRDYLSAPDIDGALVGGASLKIDSYKELLTNII